MSGKILLLYPKEALRFFLYEIQEGTASDASRTTEELVRRIAADRRIQEKIQILLGQNPIWCDSRFVDCWRAAFPEDGTVCIKTSFGACAYDKNGTRIASANNKRIGIACGITSPLCNAQEGCVRDGIVSRVDQTLGECNHAIVWLLADLFDRGYKPSSLNEIDVYEAGFLVSAGGKPWVRRVENYTCLYCVRIFLTLGLYKVWGVVGEKEQAHWHELPAAENYVELGRAARKEHAQGR